MNSEEINTNFLKLCKTVKLADAPFDIVRDPITDYLYDKTVPSDIVKAKQKRAIVELMKQYRPDLEVGWEKNLTNLSQTTYRAQAVKLFSQGNLKGVELLTLSKWGKQLRINSIDEMMEPRNFNTFTFTFWNDFEQIYQEEQSLFKTFARYGLMHKDEEFLREAYFFISNTVRGRGNYLQQNNLSYSNPITNVSRSASAANADGNRNSPYGNGERVSYN